MKGAEVMEPVRLLLKNLEDSIIQIGYVGENNHIQVQIDCSEVFEKYPEAIASMAVSNPLGQMYPAVIENEGDDVLWTITSSDVSCEGDGNIQLTFINGEEIIKTATGKTRIKNSIIGNGPAPDPIVDFVTRADAALVEIPAAIDSALEEAKESGEFDGEPGYTPQKGVDYFDGQNGAPGVDGISPTVTVTDITGGHRVVITDAEGPHSFDVMDGQGGGGSVTVDDELSDISTNPVQNKVITEEVTSLTEAIVPLEGIANIRTGKNLVNPDKLSAVYIEYNGALTDNSNYRTTDFIPVENGKTYAVGIYSSWNALIKCRYGYMLYDSSKQPITESYSNTDNLTGTTFTVNDEDAKYVRCFGQWGSGRTFMVCESTGNIPSQSEPYQETELLAIGLDTVPMAQVEAAVPGYVDNALQQYDVPIVQTKQLFDRSKVTVGYCDNTGYIDSSTGYVYTEKIPVTAGKTLYFSVDGTADSARFVCAYDANGDPVSASGSSSSASTYTVPSGIVAVRLSYTNPASTAKYAHFQAEYDEVTGYVPYGKYFDIDDYLGKDNVLWGKKWAVCGDSFTDGVLNTTIQTGRYTGKRIVYPYLIGNRNNMDIVKFFNGGQTLAFPAVPGDFTNSLTYPSGERYYQNIPADVDYITIYLGINDANHAPGGQASGEIPLGTISDETTATYYGAWNVVLSWLIVNRPNAHIGIIVTNGNSSNDYRQAQIAIAKKYGLAYIDLNGDERTPAMLRACNSDMSSAVKTALINKWAVDPSTNTHPNDDAHIFESAFIENFLRSI